ncbi:MAG: LysR family transcriptional regulator [Burkholderiales bacterium]|nr:LysR family transcriptional regulator [Burkholderiales bacterium]MDE2287151.1 LysR family transcriptional regulator [Burkholderiales bacterium]MDE2610131.1 LysR family transcriptional regulator [Burkholderiales bacterium]
MNINEIKTEQFSVDRLNFHHLFYFWCVARSGHLSRTAKQLHVSQSALSAQIRQLEERLGQPLFEREGRRLKLTDTGHLVATYADSIFDLGAEMLGRLSGGREGVTRLRVGSVATLSRNYQENWLSPLLTDPSVTLTLESGLLGGLLDRLQHHQLDVVLANEAVPADPEQPLHCQRLGSQPMSVVGRAEIWHGHRLNIPGGLHAVEMAVPGVRHAVRAQFDALCASAAVEPRIRAEVDDMAMLRLVARDSDWLTLLPEVVVQDELRTGRLVVVGVSTELTENFYAITAPNRYRPRVLDELMARAVVASPGAPQ